MTTYAIAKDLTIQTLRSFSSPDGDELSYGISWDELMSSHPHAVALRNALSLYGPTAYNFEVNAAQAHKECRICLTCTDPDESQDHDEEQRGIVAAAGLSVVDGIADEAGDHALVG